ncbi:carbohydrate ABC transporter membrane protein 1 (CUT1 family) [Flavimobilis soli]|uniref:Carbohydrate ABC transporter membrane protein 1 (CUT1 family) n=2 Tax=Flavimobilis soli TaxID=442709 RepID=A0A2A9EDU6_9MICO|nr:carbohydrate ABC transporter membrane protein 1 (CUT1 family) [Flavimobilis soli]
MDWLLHPATTGGKLLLMVFAVALFAAAMGLILFGVSRLKRPRKWVLAAAFVGPAVLGLLFGLVYPALTTIKASFYDAKGNNFIGVDNYARALSEDAFQKVLGNTAIWVILVPLLSTGIGLVYAILVDRSKFEKFAKALIFLPMAISMVGASIIWKFMYDYKAVLENVPAARQPKQIGLLNQVIIWMGGEPYNFLLNGPWNTLFLIVVMVWIQAGFAMTILSASIKAIPDDIIEAARLDGVNAWQMFSHITVPSVRPSLVVVLTTIAMGTLKVFDIVRTMTGGQFGTSVVANEFYTQSFRQGNEGLGAALAVILFIIILPLIVYNVRQMKKTEEVR